LLKTLVIRGTNLGSRSLRYHHPDGQRNVLRAGIAYPTLPFGHFFPLHVGLAVDANTILLQAEVAGWSHSSTASFGGALPFKDFQHYVFGIDIRGRANLNIGLKEVAVYSRFPTSEAMVKLGGCFKQIADHGPLCARFENGSFMHNTDHSNFPNSHPTAS
jgi:hypothetical protein